MVRHTRVPGWGLPHTKTKRPRDDAVRSSDLLIFPHNSANVLLVITAPRAATGKLFLSVRRRRAARIAGRAASTRATGPATAATAEVRLQEMRQRVHVAQRAILDAKEVCVGRAAATVCATGAEGAEHDDRTDCRVHDETAVGDVHTARHADVTAVGGGSVASVCAAFRAVARVAPRHQILLPFEKRIEVGVRG